MSANDGCRADVRKARGKSSLVVEFYESWAAFPSVTRDRDNDIVVGVHPNGLNEGGNYEFTIKDVGSGPNHRRRIALQVCLFSDSWQAFRDLPELFAALSEDVGGMAIGDARALLTSLGYRDMTSVYGERHEHTFICACGERATR